MSCTHTTGAASAVPLAFMPFDMLQTTCILTTCGCSGMLAMYRRRDDQRESLDWQSRGQAFGARALNPIECGPLPANVSFLSVLDDKTSQMLFVLWRQVALVKGHFFERTASCMKKRLSSPLLKCIPQTQTSEGYSQSPTLTQKHTGHTRARCHGKCFEMSTCGLHTPATAHTTTHI